MVGMVTADALRIMASDADIMSLTVAADAMSPPVALSADDPLKRAISLLLDNELREVPVVDVHGQIVGFVDEAEIGRAYLEATANRPADATPLSLSSSEQQSKR